MADPGYSTLTKLGLGVLILTFNSALAIYNSWGDAASVAFVLAAFVLLFLCLCKFERGGRGRNDAKIKAAVWALTTLLTAMFDIAPTIMPLGVGALVFLCLRDVDRQVRGGEGGGGGINKDAQYYCALAKVGLAMLTCNAALDVAYDAQGDPGLAALVLVSFLVLVIFTGLFVRAFARGHAGKEEQH